MRTQRALITAAVVALVLGAGFLIYRSDFPRRPSTCQICGREIPKQTAFQILTAHGTIFACCARCAMHHMVGHPGEARNEWATDVDTGRRIPAQSAFYDEGGDVQYCTAQNPAVRRVPDQGMSVRVYDRCLPVLVAFATRDEAAAYRQQHGGRVITFGQALQGVRGH
jgi:hypothetical protein